MVIQNDALLRARLAVQAKNHGGFLEESEAEVRRAVRKSQDENPHRSPEDVLARFTVHVCGLGTFWGLCFLKVFLSS